MFLVADDFAAIARRLKEIQIEVAKERAATEAQPQSPDEAECKTRDIYEDLMACS